MAALCTWLSSEAQQAGRIHRSEILPYDTRHAAQSADRNGIGRYAEFRPEAIRADGETIDVGQEIDFPIAWTDGFTYLHLENVGSAYTLRVNGREAGRSEDPFTPADFDITPYVTDGKNALVLTLRTSAAPALQEGISPVRERFTDCYLFGQSNRSVRDFRVALVPDSTHRFGVLDIEIIAQNGYNYPEPVTVAYDIYDPKGKLLDFNFREVTVPGRSVDTVRFAPYIYHTYENKWADQGKAPLYRVTVYTKRNGAMWEYMPLKVGFGKTEFRDGKFYRFDKELSLKPISLNAGIDRKATAARMKALRSEGFNTLQPDYPQPQWYYDLADEMGLLVIDRANINAPSKRGDRTVGGTPSNDPAMADEYIARVKAMYYRTRNHPSVIAYSLGGPSGNGYAMYKAYQWLKSVETERPVLYEDADGEWNSDLDGGIR